MVDEEAVSRSNLGACLGNSKLAPVGGEGLFTRNIKGVAEARASPQTRLNLRLTRAFLGGQARSAGCGIEISAAGITSITHLDADLPRETTHAEPAFRDLHSRLPTYQSILHTLLIAVSARLSLGYLRVSENLRYSVNSLETCWTSFRAPAVSRVSSCVLLNSIRGGAKAGSSRPPMCPRRRSGALTISGAHVRAWAHRTKRERENQISRSWLSWQLYSTACICSAQSVLVRSRITGQR